MSILNDGSATPTDQKSPWVQPGFIAAAAVVALLVLLGIILAVTSGPQAGTKDAVTPAPAPTPAPAARTNPDASVCGLPAGSAAVPSQAPTAKWELVGGVAAPTAPKTIGPGTVQNGLRSCFAHSPTGALYAAVNVIAMTASDAQREGFVRKLTVPGVGRDRALANLGPSSNASTALQVAGFTINDYRKSSAVVDLAFRVDTGNSAGYVHLPLAMRWLEGDWKLALPDTGKPFDGMSRMPSLSSYVAWKGA